MKNLLLVLILFVFIGCGKDNIPTSTSTTAASPVKLKIDFNNDGNADINFELSNLGTQDIPQSSGVNTYLVSSADSNLSFLSKSVSLDDYWYDINNSITFNASSNFSYKYFSAKFYSREIKMGNYINSWVIDSNYSTKKYLVFKKISNTGIKYGWIKLDFNITTKNLTVVDYFETTQTTISTGNK